jgi:arylsulfatase A-like enzyme
MTYYGSTQGHNGSVIGGIGRIGTMYGGSHALWNDETMADELVARAVSWIEGRDEERTFFLLFSSQDIHVPRTPHPRFRGATELGYRGDAMVALDWAVGQILEALDEQGLAGNTLVIFTSDNGPVYDDGYDDGTEVFTSREEVDQGHDGSGPWRGGKYQIYEGGTRVPFLVRWPGRVEPGVSPALVNQIDLLASFARLFEIELADRDAIDSRDTLDAFLGQDVEGLPYMIEEANRLALRRGTWKYVRAKQGGEPELFDLDADPSEQRNVAREHSDLARELEALLDRLAEAESGVRHAG